MSRRFLWIWRCGFAKVRQTSPKFAWRRAHASGTPWNLSEEERKHPPNLHYHSFGISSRHGANAQRADDLARTDLWFHWKGRFHSARRCAQTTPCRAAKSMRNTLGGAKRYIFNKEGKSSTGTCPRSDNNNKKQRNVSRSEMARIIQNRTTGQKWQDLLKTAQVELWDSELENSM